MLITSCDDDPITQTPTGSIYLTSIPPGAEIWIDGSNTLRQLLILLTMLMKVLEV